MASGAEIAIIILILVAVIVGIVVAIYFVWRHDQNKRTPPPPSNSGGGGDNNSFVSTQVSSGTTLAWSVGRRANDANTYLNAVLPSSAIACKDFQFVLSDTSTASNSLVWQGDGTSIVGGSLMENGTVLLLTPSEVALNPDLNYSWVYNATNKTWCASSNPNFCIRLVPPNLGINIVMGSVNNTDPTFQWDRSSLTVSNIVCS